MLQLMEAPLDQKAWKRFVSLSIPQFPVERYRYVRLHALSMQQLALPSLQRECPITLAEGTIVLVDGMYRPELSRVPAEVVALPWSQALHTYSGFLRPRLQREYTEEKDPFALLNTAYFSHGLFLYVPPKVDIRAKPLRILHLTTSSIEPLLLSPRIHLCLGKEAAATLSLHQQSGSQTVTNTYIDIALEREAQLSYFLLSRQEEEAHELVSLRATLKENSRFQMVSATNGGVTSRHDYVVRLLGEGADAILSGVWRLQGTRQHHVHALVEHQEPHCHSLQKFKGTLSDASCASFEGKVYVHQKAQKTRAYQTNHQLLLSREATAYSKPNLEIFADDVKASHGATIGQLDPEQLFYLTTRGIPPAVAHQILVQGFGRDILHTIHPPTLREEAVAVLT